MHTELGGAWPSGENAYHGALRGGVAKAWLAHHQPPASAALCTARQAGSRAGLQGEGRRPLNHYACINGLFRQGTAD